MASVAHAQSMVEVSVQDADGHPLPVGEGGEIRVRGEVVMAGYWNDPAATAAAMRGGWLARGDFGVLDEDGFLTLLDHRNDLVAGDSTNIYPCVVEEALLMHANVEEVSVVGRPDPEWGEVAVAFVVGHRALEAAELEALCLAHIAHIVRFKRLNHHHFVEAPPKNHYAKAL